MSEIVKGFEGFLIIVGTISTLTLVLIALYLQDIAQALKRMASTVHPAPVDLSQNVFRVKDMSKDPSVPEKEKT